MRNPQSKAINKNELIYAWHQDKKGPGALMNVPLGHGPRRKQKTAFRGHLTYTRIFKHDFRKLFERSHLCYQ